MAYNASMYTPYPQYTAPNWLSQGGMSQTVPYTFGQPSQQPFDALISVAGRQAVESINMPPNSRAIYFDQNVDVMYVATTDGAGYKTITEFDYAKRDASGTAQGAQYVTKEEFDALAATVASLSARKKGKAVADDQ